MSKEPQTSTIQNTLIELGLAENEAKLYEILLATPNATIPALKQKSPLSRTMLYYVLKSLGDYGLVETAEVGKKTVYNAAPPEQLAEFFVDREKELKRQKDMLGDVLGDLRSTYLLAHQKLGVRFFEGLDGFKTVTFDSLKAQGEILTFLDVDATQKYATEINAAYVKERVKRGITKRQIAVDSPATRERYKDYRPLLDVRLMPAGFKPFQTSVQIYNNTVSFATLNDSKMIGVIIEDEQITQMHRSLFEYVWSTLPALPSVQNLSRAAAVPDKPAATVQPPPVQNVPTAKEPTLQERMLADLGGASSDSK
ncbi:MAG: hypothetical protein HY983_02665 [Candidatus Magasanikbacteria bacterium]|nr:hypothetical protein [Candidatus Magasanikbacteria bacterium]